MELGHVQTYGSRKCSFKPIVVGHLKQVVLGHVQTYGSRTSERGQAKLQLHVATRRWLRDLAGLEAPGYCGSVEELAIFCGISLIENQGRLG